LATKKRWNIWSSSSLLILLGYILFLVYPLVMILSNSVFIDGSFTIENFVRFFSHRYFRGSLMNSFQVSLAATFFALALGMLLAYLFAMYEFKGKKLIQILVIIASMSAPFISAYSWILLLGRNGAITNFVSSLGLPTFDIYGFGGITMVFTLQLFPLIFLYINGAFKNMDRSLLEAAESLGYTGIRKFFKVIFPLLIPTVLAGCLLVFMRAFSDFGTPMLIGEGFRTFPVLIFSEFVGEVRGDTSFASALALIAIGIALLVFVLQRVVARKFSYSMTSFYQIEPKKTTGLKRILIYLVVYGAVFIAILPQGFLMYTSFRNSRGIVFHEGYSFDNYIEAFNRMGTAIFNTIRISFFGTVLVVVVAIFVSYLAVRKRNVWTWLIDNLSMIPFIVPGTVFGISLLFAFNTGIGGTGILRITGTALIIIIALSVRRLPYTIRSSVTALMQIPISIEEAAESLGSSRINTFFRITVPMMLSGVIAGAILSWITMLSELATSVLLYNVRTRTMTVAIYTEVLRGNFGIAAALATILSAMTIVLLLIFLKISKNNLSV